jgi:hypothetical protein
MSVENKEAIQAQENLSSDVKAFCALMAIFRLGIVRLVRKHRRSLTPKSTQDYVCLASCA